MQSAVQSPFHGIGYKQEQRDFGGRTRSGTIYNIGRADIELTTGFVGLDNINQDAVSAAALRMWRTTLLEKEEDTGDAFSTAKTLCNLGRKWHEAASENRDFRDILGTLARTTRDDVEAGSAFFYKCRGEFVDRYTMNLCDILLGSLETGDWSWAKEETLMYW